MLAGVTLAVVWLLSGSEQVQAESIYEEPRSISQRDLQVQLSTREKNGLSFGRFGIPNKRPALKSSREAFGNCSSGLNKALIFEILQLFNTKNLGRDADSK